MGNTFFYQDVKADKSNITWRKILSDAFRKHTKDELEYAMTAGMAVNTATEEDMLRKWHKPWVFWKVALIGGGLILFCYLCYFILAMIGMLVPAVYLLSVFIPPMVVPIVVMLFVWELNIPKNISIFELLGCFFIGGVGSIVFSLMFNFVLMIFTMIFGLPMEILEWAPLAAFTEEPGKFLAAFLCVLFLQRGGRKKIYGVTALTIGAAVGAGFSAFESVQYVFSGELASGTAGTFGAMFSFIFSRLIGSFGTHTLWCALYIGAMGIAAEKTKKFGIRSFGSGLFWITMLISMASHFLWNFIATYVFFLIGYIFFAIMIVLQWLIFLWIVKKALYQVIAPAKYQSGTGAGFGPEVATPYPYQRPVSMQSAATVEPRVTGQTASIKVMCIKGVLAGKGLKSSGKQKLIIGRTGKCQFRYPQNTLGVSREHCCIYSNAKGWVLVDMNSSYGTYVNGRKISPGIEYVLSNGDQIALGGDEQVYQVQFV